MALTYLWAGFFIVGFLAALGQWIFLGDTEVFKKIVDGTFDSAKVGVMDIALPLAGVMTLWLGILNVGEKAGFIGAIAKLIAPFFSRIFPDVPKNHPATCHMVMNFSANFLGLDNAATPFGLKAMESLQSLNPVKDTASNAQIMFLVLQTAGLTLIPLTVMAQRAVLGIVWYFSNFLTREEIQTVSKVASNFILLGIIVLFLVGGLRKKVNVYEAFIEGAKGGIQTSLMIIPYLVGMLVAISVLRNSGVLGFVVGGFTWLFTQLGFNTDFTPGLRGFVCRSVGEHPARVIRHHAIYHCALLRLGRHQQDSLCALVWTARRPRRGDCRDLGGISVLPLTKPNLHRQNCGTY